MNLNPVAEIWQDKGYSPLTFGFDIGIASVGWAVLSEGRIVDLGVRAFPAAEDPKERISLNQARRAARTSRNRLAQRRSRLDRLLRLFVDIGLLQQAETTLLFGAHQALGAIGSDTWALRAKAVNNTDPLTQREFCQVLYTLVKSRGYGSLRDAKDRAEAEGETPQSKPQADGPAGESDLLAGGKPPPELSAKPLAFGVALDKVDTQFSGLLIKYKTVGNLVWTLHNNPQNATSLEEEALAKRYRKAVRNHQDGYERSYLRKHLRLEIKSIFQHQRELGNSFADAILAADKAALGESIVGVTRGKITRSFEDQVLAVFDEQHPPIVQAHLEQLIGECELIEGQQRAARRSFSAERSAWLQTLNRLEVSMHGQAPRKLLPTELSTAQGLPYSKELEKKELVTYADLRSIFCTQCEWPRDWQAAKFTNLSYRSVATPNSDGIKIISETGEPIPIKDRIPSTATASKQDKAKAKKDFYEWLAAQTLTGSVTLDSLRAKLAMTDSERFRIVNRTSPRVNRDAERDHELPLDSNSETGVAEGHFIKTASDKTGKSPKLSKAAFDTLRQWARSSPADKKTFADLRRALQATPADGNWQFVLERSKVEKPAIEEEKDCRVNMTFTDPMEVEKDTLFKSPGWHAIRKCLEPVAPEIWKQLSKAADFAENQAAAIAATEDLDAIAEGIAKNFTDKEIRDALAKVRIGLPVQAVDSLLKVVFSGFAHLSLGALRQIRQKLERGEIYSRACELAGLDHSGSSTRRKPSLLLPPLVTYLYKRISVKTGKPKIKIGRDGKGREVVEKRFKGLANPVVARSFNQARTVLNALVDQYGSPAYVAIELARDLSKPGAVRKQIDIDNKARAKERESNLRKIEALRPGRVVSAKLARKVRMREEQGCKCMYSGKELDLETLLTDDNYAQTDHILPLSRTNDNSLDNQILVLAGENQRKGNRTPYEWFGASDPEKWHQFKIRVANLPLLSERKRQKLLLEGLDDQEFTGANLVDTRYATRLFASAVREGLVFREGTIARDEGATSDDTGRIRHDRFMRARVRTPQGGVTSMLRGLWGLSKKREEGDLHHAIDACVIAAASPALIRRLNNYNRFKETVIVRPNGELLWREPDSDGVQNALTRDEAAEFTDRDFPQPFAPEMFHQEVMARLSRDGRTYATKRGHQLEYQFANYSEAEKASVKPVTVSRLRQPGKRNNELHDSQPKALRRVSIPLAELTIELLRIERYPDTFRDQNSAMFAAMHSQLASHGGDAAAAFSESFDWNGQKVFSIHVPWLCLSEEERNCTAKRLGVKPKEFNGTRVDLPLVNLTLGHLTEEALGSDIWRREKPLIDALRNALSEPNAKAKDIFKNGFLKPESEAGRRRRESQGIVDFIPPLVKSIRVPKSNNSGFLIRGGLAGTGAAISVQLVKNMATNRYRFIPRYAIKNPVSVGIEGAEPGADEFRQFSLIQNTFVAIDHQNVKYCYSETGRHATADGNIVIDAEPIFPDGVFKGYFNNYEPSNERPVLELHDHSSFFLLDADQDVELEPLKILHRKKSSSKQRKNATANGSAEAEFEYVLLKDVEQSTAKPRVFAFTAEISRKIANAKSIERLRLDPLGRLIKG